MAVFGLLSSLVMLVGFPLLLAVLLREAILSCTAPPGAPSQAQCDACGYPVAGLQGMTCPECGGNLLVSGIRTAASEARRRGHLFWGLVAWTGFMALGTMVLLSVTMMFWGFRGAMAVGATRTSTTVTITPASGAGPTLQASASVTTSDDTGAVEQTTLTLTPTTPGLAQLTVAGFGGSSSVHWTDAGGAVRQPVSIGGATGTALNASTAAAWLTGLGTGQSAGLSDEEVSELVRIVGELSKDPSTANAGPLFTLTPAGTSTARVPSVSSMTRLAWIPGLVTFAGLGFWIVGMVYIPLRRKALRARFAVTPGRRRRAASGAAAFTPG